MGDICFYVLCNHRDNEIVSNSLLSSRKETNPNMTMFRTYLKEVHAITIVKMVMFTIFTMVSMDFIIWCKWKSMTLEMIASIALTSNSICEINSFSCGSF